MVMGVSVIVVAEHLYVLCTFVKQCWQKLTIKVNGNVYRNKKKTLLLLKLSLKRKKLSN